jgi:hypothetical protein
MKLLTWNGIALSVSRLAYAETAAIVFAGDRRKGARTQWRDRRDI